MSQDDQSGRAEVALRESDLRDEIEAIGRKQLRVVLSYVSILVILGIALFEGTFAFPAATLGILILVPLKKSIVRYRALAREKAELLKELTQSVSTPISESA